ncbi:hypothetical protein WMY93_031404 [Mugilogobius chulae]|uniref:Apolipoprotein L3 n=1 Tax=Mugilogobius chulae TaxID=88201 RepID=A0AAW0MDN5_9GOBI
MERLSVTSVYVFQKNLNPEMDLEKVRFIIATAQILAPLLLLFKQDDDTFFRPNVLNKDVYLDKLQKYIIKTRELFDGWRKALENFNKVQPNVSVEDLSEEDIEKMLYHICMLSTLRTNLAFKMVDLFQGRSQRFREKFSELKPQMEQSLNDLESCAQQLDSMNLGARISGVAGSIEGIVAGALSIAGLILAPFTGGLSLLLDVGGLGLGIVSGVQGIVTTSVEHGVNNTQNERAKQAFDKSMKQLNELHDFLNDFIQQHFEGLKENVLNEVIEGTFDGGVFSNDLAGLGSLIYENMTRNRLSADALFHVTEGEIAIGRVEIAGVRMAKIVRIGSSVLNGAFIAADIGFLCKDSIALAQGTETELSHWIRARITLWSSEMESWQKVHDSLYEGEKGYEKNKETINMSFYPQI